MVGGVLNVGVQAVQGLPDQAVPQCSSWEMDKGGLIEGDEHTDGETLLANVIRHKHIPQTSHEKLL